MPKYFFQMRTRLLLRLCIVVAILISNAVGRIADGPVKLVCTSIAPVEIRRLENGYFADFGKDRYAGLTLRFKEVKAAEVITVILGEKIGKDGLVDTIPGGSISCRQIVLELKPGELTYQLAIPTKDCHATAASIRASSEYGEVTPYRYVELRGGSASLGWVEFQQTWIHAEFDDTASCFVSSDPTLNAIWDLCKHTVKTTTAFGVYIDGERERIPYEADAYINQLSHYACDLDPRVARATINHLIANPTWPTEWSFHLIMMAAVDYRETGDAGPLRIWYPQLQPKLLQKLARKDGLLEAYAIVDWPPGERDGFGGLPQNNADSLVGPLVNAPVNAFYYHALEEMASIAEALGRRDDAERYRDDAKMVWNAFNRVFWDAETGLYRDGEGSQHISVHANMFALAFGLVPSDRVSRVVSFLKLRGMACSVYGAQYLLEAFFRSGHADAAVELMVSHSGRSWWHMIELGSSMTLEAWDRQNKDNLTWNHAWGTAPANIISHYLLGVRPLAPGYERILISPQLGGLAWVAGKVPTPLGPVTVDCSGGQPGYRLVVTIPDGCVACVVLPHAENGIRVATLNGKSVVGEMVELKHSGKYEFVVR